MYKYIMIIGGGVVLLGWLAYGIYSYIDRRREQKMPRQRSKRYRQAQQSMSEYAKKMADFQKKRHNKKQ